MTPANYLYEKLMLLFLNLFCAIAMTIYLALLGNSFSSVLPILIIWAVILFIVWGNGFYKQKKKAEQITRQLDLLDQKYLICEMLDKPKTCSEQLFQQTLRTACKSMLEKINHLKKSQYQYKEYIEEWIHEIKTPITAIDLICKNHPETENKRIGKELSRINYLVEQALYYARSENVEKDYFVKEFQLFDAIRPALLENRSLLLEEKIALQIEETDDIVYTDEKWLTYIISQILSNSIKYHRTKDACIKISAAHTGSSVSLILEDNGRGIPAADLPRVFATGFPGTVRTNRQSTGMGLYLCRKLCLKLGLSIRADSVCGEGTKITIDFPTGTYIRPE